MRIEAAGQRFVRLAANMFLSAASVLNRAKIAKKDRADRSAAIADQRRGASVQERRAEVLSFYGVYEDFVEILCDAAQYGPTPLLESRYVTVRNRFLAAYSGIRPFLISYVRPSEEDIESVIGRAVSDPFQALATFNDLNELLKQDDGSMISRINRTREALNLYAEHLRQLAARKG